MCRKGWQMSDKGLQMFLMCLLVGKGSQQKKNLVTICVLAIDQVGFIVSSCQNDPTRTNMMRIVVCHRQTKGWRQLGRMLQHLPLEMGPLQDLCAKVSHFWALCPRGAANVGTGSSTGQGQRKAPLL